MLEHELWTATGKTPVNSVRSALAMHINHHGCQSVFERTRPATFTLRAWSTPHEASPLTPAAPASVATDRSAKARSGTAGEGEGTLSFTDAAEQVLTRFGKSLAMHYRDITAKALELGLVATQGKTPEATMYSQILLENARREKRGESPRFFRHGKGFIGLTQRTRPGLAEQIGAHNAAVRKRLHARLRELPPEEFETLVGTLLGALGFADVLVTARSGDGGIDVRGTLVVGDVIRTRMAVQVKRWKHNVQAPIIQQVRGSLGAHDQGLIITTSDFSKGAREEAAQTDKTPVALMNGEQFVALLVEHNILVRRTSHDLIELGEDEDE